MKRDAGSCGGREGMAVPGLWWGSSQSTMGCGQIVDNPRECDTLPHALTASYSAFSSQPLEIEGYIELHRIFDPFTYIISASHP